MASDFGVIASGAATRGTHDAVETDTRSGSDIMVAVVITLWQVLLIPLIAACWVERRSLRNERVFMACSEFLSLMPGSVGNLARKAFYGRTIHHCARRAYLSFGTLLVTRAAAVGERTFVGPYCVIGAARLGRGVRLGSRVSIMSGRHQHGSSSTGVVNEEFSHHGCVTVGDGTWIGEGAIVMADVGRDCIVGAGAVVIREVPDGTTVVGNPARELPRRP